MPDVFAVSYVALWVFVLLQALIVLALTRAFAEMRGASADRPTLKGRRAPQFSAVDLSGNPVSMEGMVGRAMALLFVSPTCASCRVTLAELRGITSDRSRDLAVVCEGEEAECRGLAADYQLTHPMVADTNGELKRLFGVTGTPMAVRVSADGVIESYGEPAREELEQLLTEPRRAVQESPATRTERPIGDDYSHA
jgi:hypothetical protein